ncbi:succinate dehydrogenase assembly factor 2 [Acidovorax lacteus]|uniref:FAD assembly factor SdhE n=1 Tax=Acidovorax lacteus TaxID=1924988 RepID=A0ABP8LFK8_9BURK
MASTEPLPTPNGSPLLSERELSKLHWRCRRGLLENDLFIEQFFLRHEAQLTQWHAQGLLALMDLADNDLLDLLLRRREPEDALDVPEVHAVLGLLRAARGTPTALRAA